MQKVFYTYGSEGAGMPFVGGWTEIIAPNASIAHKIFMELHPNKRDPETLNCAFIYSETEFLATPMATYGNMGHGCWERITLTKEEFC